MSHLCIRPELAESTLRMLDADSEVLPELFPRLTRAILAGEPIDLAETPNDATIAHELTLAVRVRLNAVSWDGSEAVDWRYLSDLAALAGDIEQRRQ